MARLTKETVIEKLNALGVEFDENEEYSVLCKLLKDLTPTASDPDTIEEMIDEPQDLIHLENRIAKRNTFLADSIRNDRDTEVLRAEITKREHKGKIFKIVTTKYMDVNADGYFVTEFDIHLK